MEDEILDTHYYIPKYPFPAKWSLFEQYTSWSKGLATLVQPVSKGVPLLSPPAIPLLLHRICFSSPTMTAKVYHGYLVLVSTFILNFCAIGIFNSAGLYLGPLATTFPTSGSGTLALYCTLQIVTG